METTLQLSAAGAGSVPPSPPRPALLRDARPPVPLRQRPLRAAPRPAGPMLLLGLLLLTSALAGRRQGAAAESDLSSKFALSGAKEQNGNGALRGGAELRGARGSGGGGEGRGGVVAAALLPPGSPAGAGAVCG